MSQGKGPQANYEAVTRGAVAAQWTKKGRMGGQEYAHREQREEGRGQGQLTDHGVLAEETVEAQMTT